ncbi:MAG: hypothetical protein Q9177_006077 [Variospora cf. flavescens]
MADNSSPDSRDEKIRDEKTTARSQPEMADPTGRRQSVALNIVENPLRRFSPEKTAADARIFAETHDMAEHADLFARAALVAREPNQFDGMTELDDGERAALAYERDHKWHGSKMLWYSIGLCAIGAATQGWDQTGSNGANLSFPSEFGLADAEGVVNPGRDEWIVGVINAIIFLTAGLIGAFIVDPLNHYFGRRGEIFITACILTATPIGSGFAQSWQGLFAARFIMGIGIGAKNATVPIYSAEMAPARIRGALVMFWQLWVVAGIFLGFCANVIVKDTGDISWRLQLGSAFIPSFVLGVGIFFCPESPRWLMKHGKYAKGFRSMVRLRDHPIIAARDFYYSYVIYVEELNLARGAGYFARLWDCFAVPRIRRANYGASTVMIAQQMFVYLFTMAYSLGEGPVAFQYSAEVFPTIQREQGMAWAVCINNTFAGILSLTFPRMQSVMTPTGAFGFYAGLNLIAWFMIFCFVRETKQLTLEELDQVFSVPTSKFIGHELKVWLPYFIKRHILRKRIAKPPQIIEKDDKVKELVDE